MGLKKQRRKLVKVQEKAQVCTSREEAQKILQKAAKATHKLDIMMHSRAS